MEYSLTDVAKSFIPILDSMYTWGKSYASYRVSQGQAKSEYRPGAILENIDEPVQTADKKPPVK